MREIRAWTHATATSGDGTVPVVAHSVDVPDDSGEWHLSTDDEYERYETYWGKEFPHLPAEVIPESFEPGDKGEGSA